MDRLDYENLDYDNLDYEAVGFKCGIEIHQQLYTQRKLFCRCPAGLYSDTHDVEVLRHMRPTLSELGEYDGTALMEYKTKKNVVYLLNRESVCTYEMDDTPPFPINQEAVDKAIQIALMFGMNVIDEVHVARKQYLDGSIPTGFQRTAIIGVDGFLPYKDRQIRIFQLNVEEDACREVKDEGHYIWFRTDRLGMPLIEIITAPEMRTPDEAKEVVELLGRVCKASGNVRRGIGSVRQDVNVSVIGGTRVEIKGVPKYGLIPTLTHNEAIRQLRLLALQDRLARHGITEQNLSVTERVITDVVKEMNLVAVFPNMREGDEVRAVKLSGLSGVFSTPVQQGFDFAHEVKGRIRVIACIDVPPIMVHTDSWPNYDGWENDRATLMKEMQAGEGDAIALVCGAQGDTVTAAQEIKLRIIDALRGVPSETRQAMPGGLTDFERILPGPDRMYPDTDTPPTEIKHERVERLRTTTPAPPWEMRAKLAAIGAPAHHADVLSISPYASVFTKAVKVGTSAKFAAVALVEWNSSLLKQASVAGIPAGLTEDRLLKFFAAFNAGRFQREIAKEVLMRMAERPGATVDEILGELAISEIPQFEIEALVEEAKAANFTPRKRHAPAEIKWKRYVMGLAMKELRGSVAGGKVSEMIGEYTGGAALSAANGR